MSNPRFFFAKINGPKGGPYAEGIFHVQIFIPKQYPMEKPDVQFKTKIYHPNVDSEGRVGLDIVQNKWMPNLQLRDVLAGIQMLLTCPNMEDPMDEVVADHFLNDEHAACKQAREWTEEYAEPVPA